MHLEFILARRVSEGWRSPSLTRRASMGAHIMTRFCCLLVASLALALPLGAQDWTKESKDKDKRAALHGSVQIVRGDSGKWNDDGRVQHAPPIAQKPAKTSLDAWADQLQKKKPELTVKDEHWLIFVSEQLDDNDRVWVERIEKRGTQIN